MYGGTCPLLKRLVICRRKNAKRSVIGDNSGGTMHCVLGLKIDKDASNFSYYYRTWQNVTYAKEIVRISVCTFGLISDEMASGAGGEGV